MLNAREIKTKFLSNMFGDLGNELLYFLENTIVHPILNTFELHMLIHVYKIYSSEFLLSKKPKSWS